MILTNPAIAYIRVSTKRQQASGLGLEAQQEALARFGEVHGYAFAKTFQEAETGKGADALERRPQLAAALKAAKKLKAPGIVAKLDCLSRDVHFISGLMALKVPFIVTELGPNVDPFMLHIHAAVAEQERRRISQRTRDALRAKIAQGAKLGGLNDAGRKKQAEAKRRAEGLRPVFEELEGMTTREIAEELNERRTPTPTGAAWSAMTVSRVLKRLRALN